MVRGVATLLTPLALLGLTLLARRLLGLEFSVTDYLLLASLAASALALAYSWRWVRSVIA